MQAFTSRLSLVLVALALISPASAFAQLTKAGVVTTLQGTATVTRASLSQPQPLKFRDDVFVQDRVVTGDDSVARILLGGEAIVTVRERSSLTISESPGDRKSTRLNSSHLVISYAVFCLKKKKKN